MAELTDLAMGHDLHAHTTLSSCCSDPEQTAANILRKAEELGMHTIGFSNHMWENPEHAPSDWYAPQNLEHVLRLREDLAKVESPVRVLVGCESEYCGDGKIGISEEAAAQLDYVIIPHTHIHMGEVVKQPEDDTPEALAKLMTATFKELVQTGLPTGVAHPFLPLGRWKITADTLACISDGQFDECFGLAEENGVAIEIHPSQFVGFLCPDDSMEMDADAQYRRMLIRAKEAGVKFFLGSDAHKLELIGLPLKYRAQIADMGITDEHFLPLAIKR